MLSFKKVLVTGGAGFIGSHLVDGLVGRGYQVRVLDNLYKQIHPLGKIPDYFNPCAQLIKGDVVKRKDWSRAIDGVDAIFHFASAVGVGQSMYEIEHYVKVNSLGTAILLDILANDRHQVKKIIVAASMSSYGEGSYRCNICGLVRPPIRNESDLFEGIWEPACPVCCKSKITPVAIIEEAKQNSNSIYAIGKKNQEEMILNIGLAYNIPSVALRYFNVYGTRQSLSNPYNGVVAIFISRVKNNKPPVINEDGLQTRDFIHIDDVTRANIAVLENKAADYQTFNVGSGKPVSILEVANIIIRLFRSKLKPNVSYKTRKLDVRHCYADISKIKELLNWQPQVKLSQGLFNLLNWSKTEVAIDKVDYAMQQLEKRRLR